MNSKISVILPTFNRAAILPRAVDSVLKQKQVNWELILVDDGSDDHTSEVIQPYLQNHNIRYVAQSHRGVSAARNFGVELSSGKWIAFLDSDDEWLPEKLKQQLDYMLEGNWKIAQTQEIWIRKGTRVNPPEHLKKKQGDLFLASLRNCMITPSSVMMEKNFFLQTGGFRDDFPACEDYDLWLKITSRHPVGLLDRELLVRYGGHPDQLSSTVPVLDRFRVRALSDLLRSQLKDQSLDYHQLQEAMTVLHKKLGILKAGSEKRENWESVREWERVSEEFDPQTFLNQFAH